MLLADQMVLFGSSVSWSNLFLIISNADATGTAMKSTGYIMGSDAFPLFYLGFLYFICKFVADVDMLDSLTYKGFENSC